MMATMHRWLLAAWTAAWMMTLFPQASFAAEAPEPASYDAGQVQTWIEGLGADAFRTRRASQKSLEQIPFEWVEPTLDACVKTYARTTDVEVKQRLDEIMFSLVDKHLYDAPNGFMGIRLSKAVIPAGDGQAVIHAVAVNEVIENTGAAEAGMQNGDLIIGVNGKDVPEDPSTLAFTQYIQTHRPGTVIDVVFLRDGKRMETKMRLGERPPQAMIFSSYQIPVEDFYQEWLEKSLESANAP